MDLSILRQLDLKKILLILGFLVICFVLGFGIYWLFFRAPTLGPGDPGYLPPGATLPDTDTGPGGTVVGPDGGELPTAGDIDSGGDQQPNYIADGGDTTVLPLHQDKVNNVVLSANGQGVNFYSSSDNKFYTLSEDGDKVLLSDQEFFNVNDVTWSNDRTKAIIEYPDDAKILFDFTTNKQLSLNKEINDPEFSSQDQVAYKFVSEDGENNWLAVAEPDGSSIELIEPLGDNVDLVQVTWSPSNEVVALFSKPTGLNASEIFFIGLKGENFKSMVVDGTNFKGKWTPNGSKLVYHVVNSYNNYNPILYMADAVGDNIGRHKFNLGLSTWIDKCVFESSVILYCAVPRELPEGAGLYPEVFPDTNDLIYKIDLATGLKDLLANPVLDGQNNFSISSVYLSKDNKFLFFWDLITEQVYKIQLR